MHMERDDPFRIWAPLVGSTIFVCLLSTIRLPLLLLLPVLAAMTYLMQVQIFRNRSLARSFWLTTYLKHDSPIREILDGSVFLHWLAVLIAIPLACITYVTVFGYSLFDCILVSVAVFTARGIHKHLSAPIDRNLSENLVELAHLRIYYWLAISFVIAALAISSLAEGMLADYSTITSDQIATKTVDSIKHPVTIVQHCARTLKYSELQLLRIRDINGWPWGWYILFLFSSQCTSCVRARHHVRRTSTDNRGDRTRMRYTAFAILMVLILTSSGCYYEEYKQAIEMKEQAEEKAAQAKDALTAEQKAINRLYTEE